MTKKISNKALRELNSALNTKIAKKAPAQATVVQATVTKATDGDLWVKIDGSSTSTPCESTSVSIDNGDTVTVRIANGKATITGNLSKQATNVTETNAIVQPVAQVAEVAQDTAQTAQSTAETAQSTAETAQSTAETAQDTASSAQQTASSAYISATTAKTTADNAKTAADQAQSLANATSQHFWSGDDGVHVTTNTQEEWSSGDTTGANLLANTQGVLIRDGLNPLTGMTSSGFSIYDGDGSADTNVIASFEDDGAQIGKDGQTRAEITANAFKLVDKEGNYYMYVSDLRDPATGLVEITETLIAAVISGQYRAKLTYSPTTVTKVQVGSPRTEITDYTVSGSYIYYPLTYNTTNVEVVYNSSTNQAKAFTFGVRNTSSKLGALSSAFGSYTTASGNSSHAEGYISQANGYSSHAEGYSSLANGYGSHAEGYSSLANGYGSHAEGSGKVTASGHGSHAEGNSTTASGDYSHAEGQFTTASGDYSHAQNNRTLAYSDSQTAMGKYNVADSNDTYALIIGNGTSSTRSNALTLDWNGNLTIAGELTSATPSSTLPIGTVNAYAGTTAPSGWLLCQGQSISRTTYADLFAVIGTTYGSNTSTTFCLPDLGGKMAIGVGGDGEVATEYSLGDEGGEETHLLTTAEMPSHTHTQNSHWHASYAGTNYRILSYNYTAAGSTGVTERAVAKASSGNYMAPVVNNASTDWVGHNQTSNTTATNQNTGGNGYHNNMPPYLALNYIIYAGV